MEHERLARSQPTPYSAQISGRRDRSSFELPLRIAGSDDPLLARLARETNALVRVNGSTAGLVALAQKEAEVVGSHLREPDSNEYNISFVQHLVAEEDILLVHLAIREYGLVVAAGNPKHLRRVRDIERKHVRLLNRSRGSGARMWLQRHLRNARLDPNTIPNWSSEAGTYEEIAGAIVLGQVDVGPGLRATAEKFHLGFVPLGVERFDLAIPRSIFESKRGDKLRAALLDRNFLDYARTLPGYDLARSGRVIAEIKFGQRKRKGD
jgi:putative molybdopterin biosynthesis protein